MFVDKLLQLPTVPSVRLNINSGGSKPSASSTESVAPSPTRSSHNTSTSVDRATSASDPEDYADVSAAKTVPSRKMGRKTTAALIPDQVDDNGSRRASGRLRKPTAKAVALNGSKSYSPPLSDTIVIGESPPKRRRSSNKERSPEFMPFKGEPEEMQPEPEVPETPANPKANGIQTPSPEDVAHDEAPAPVTETTPSRRHSQRERKPTSKALSETLASQKRPAPEESQDAPPRKSARISLSGAKIPSKLRYSLSAEQSEADDTREAEQVEIPETAATKKSKIIVLKFKPQRDVPDPSTKLQAIQAKNAPPPSKEKSRRTSARQKATTKDAPPKPEPRPRPVEMPQSCNLSCLSPSSRLVAFAEIALKMPDEEDENEEVIPGSVYDWRMYTQVWCQCDKINELKTDRTNSAELARALMPNTISQGTKYDPIVLSTSQTPESELLSTPVNTILRAGDAERLSQLYIGPSNHVTGKAPYSAPTTSSKRPAEDDLPAPSDGRSLQKRVSINESPNSYSPFPQPSYPTRRTYEDRLRDDYNALADIRKKAAAQGISWTFNMTFDDIHMLIIDAEDREQQTQYRQQVLSPPQGVLVRGTEATESRPSPMGFGVLLPPKGTTYIQRTANGQQQRKDSPAATASANGAPEAAYGRPGISNISFVEESNPANPSKVRRPSSPSRPKSSRFRVDPRGLRGERPGPGTIINMSEKAAEFKKKAAGIARFGEAMRDFRAMQKIGEDKRNEKWRLQREQWEGEEQEKQKRMMMNGTVAANGNGQA